MPPGLLTFPVSRDLGPAWGALEDWMVSLWFFQQRVSWLPLLQTEAPGGRGNQCQDPWKALPAPKALPGPLSPGAHEQLLSCLPLPGCWPLALLPEPEPAPVTNSLRSGKNPWSVALGAGAKDGLSKLGPLSGGLRVAHPAPPCQPQRSSLAPGQLPRRLQLGQPLTEEEGT